MHAALFHYLEQQSEVDGHGGNRGAGLGNHGLQNRDPGIATAGSQALTDIDDPLSILGPFNPKLAWEGLRLFMVSTTGEQFAYYELDADLVPRKQTVPAPLAASARLIAENCEPSICSVLFMGGAGGSLRAGVTENPVRLTKSVKQALTHVSCGGAQAYVWPGGGITVMVDVLDMPTDAFGYVPTPALVAPIEFTLRVSDYAALGGHVDQMRRVSDINAERARHVPRNPNVSDPMDRANFRCRADPE